MQVNSVQSNNYSQQSFGAKMDEKLVKGIKTRLVSAIKASKEQEEILKLTDLSKQFDKYLKDIDTENNVTTIKIVNRGCSEIVQAGCGYEKRLLLDKFGIFGGLEKLMKEHPADTIKQTEKEFLEKFNECKKLKNEALSSPFLQGNKKPNFFQRLFGRKG